MGGLGASPATTLVLGAAYTLWMVKRVVFGPVANDQVAALSDINPRETWMLALLGASILLVGLWPFPLLELMHASVDQLLEQARVIKF
jgi:NADH-quinone oxidoreductase subunit M